MCPFSRDWAGSAFPLPRLLTRCRYHLHVTELGSKKVCFPVLTSKEKVMIKTLSLTLFTLSALTFLAGQAIGEETTEKREKQARKLCKQFWDDVAKKDLDGLMKTVDIPFYARGEKKTNVIRNKDELRKLLSRLFPGPNAPNDLTFEVKEVLTYEKMLEKYGKQIEDDERKLLDEVLKKDDLVLNLQFKTSEGKNLDRLVTMVGWRKGNAKVIGVRD